MSDPPPYLFSSDPIPEYTPEPHTNETRLEYRPVRPPSTERDGIYVQKNDNLTIVLQNLTKNVEVPCYGRQASILGSLHFDNPVNILKVSLKLIGRIQVHTSSYDFDVEILNETHTLYPESKQSDRTSSDCPDALPFTIPFPEEFNYDGEKQKLPPTYRVGVGQEQYAECKYDIQVLVIAPRTLAFLGNTTNKSSIEIRYNPRSRPPHPILHNHSLIETIKTCPEEWKEFHLNVPPFQEGEGLVAQLYLPAVGIFALTDAIPFHLQFTGSSSLISTLSTEGNGGIVVSLYRRFRVVQSRYAVGFTIGETIALKLLSSYEADCLNWEGMLKVKEDSDVTVGSFSAGPIAVDDFVAVELHMSEREGGPKVVRLKEGVRVKLVSDTWSEAPGR